MHDPTCSLKKPTEVMNGVLSLMDTAIQAEQILLEDALTGYLATADEAEVDGLWAQVQTALEHIVAMDAEAPDDIRLCIVAERLNQYLKRVEDVDPAIWRMALAGCAPENETDALIRRAVDLACAHLELTASQPCF